MMANARSLATEINWGRVIAFTALFLILAVLLVDPAFAQSGAFGEFQDAVTTRTEEATGVATMVLYAAAVLAVIIGIAPMLWGQVKVKWMVTSCCAALLFGLAPMIIDAFKYTGG